MCVYIYVFFKYLLLQDICLVTIWESPPARTESSKIPNFRLFLTLKMAFSKGKNKKKVVFVETRELPWRPVGFRGDPWASALLENTRSYEFFAIVLYVHIHMHTNSYISPCLYISFF